MSYPKIQRGWIIGSLAAIVGLGNLSIMSPASAAASNPIRRAIACPAELQNLMPLLLRDLPSYANRVNQRAYVRDGNPDIPGYVLLTGQPDYQPLTLAAGERSPDQLPPDALPPNALSPDALSTHTLSDPHEPPQVFLLR
ncbi:MAG: hypothetical protein HC772_18635 [Leptolyngbyaceae cyanobacterium CRU_2_3]|nr:hypothetical protein [Leptolyngbyaceae cyanobacterium CRU_2_3]